MCVAINKTNTAEVIMWELISLNDKNDQQKFLCQAYS